MDSDFYYIIEKNKRLSFLLIIVFIALFVFLGGILDFFLAVLPYPIFTISAFFISAILSLISFFWGGEVIMNAAGAVPLAKFNTFEYKRALNIVSEMAIASGTPMPKAYVLSENFPNAFTSGSSPKRACMCLTRGIIMLLNRDELQGVIAHEFAHILHRDTLKMTCIATLWGAISILSEWILKGMWAGKRKINFKKGGALPLVLIGFALALISPLLARILAMAISRNGEYMADAGAVKLTRNPLGLASALEKIMNFQGKGETLNSMRFLFTVDPLRNDLCSKKTNIFNFFNTHPPVEKRIIILRKMAGETTEPRSIKLSVKRELICPGCGGKMSEKKSISTYGKLILLDQCESCGGVWFDRWELASLGPSPVFEEDFDRIKFLTPSKPSSGRMICPRCGIKLKNVKSFDLPEKITFKMCELCSGIWLNKEEKQEFFSWRKKKSYSNKFNDKLSKFSGEYSLRKETLNRLTIGEILSSLLRISL